MQARNNSFKYSLFLIIFLFGCNNPKEVDKNTLGKVYVDIMVAQEIYLPNFDSLKIHKEKIFKKYDIKEEDYNYTLEKYKADTETWNEFFASSLAYLDTLKKQNLK